MTRSFYIFQKNICFFFMLIAFTLLAIIAGLFGSELNTEYNIINRILYHSEVGIEVLNTTTVDDIITDCEGSDFRIDGKLECIKTHVLRFYSHQVRPDEQNISFATLMNEGGDCANWAEFWLYIGKGLGFHGQTIRIPVNSTLGHKFTLITNEQGYCTIDQITLNCVIYG